MRRLIDDIGAAARPLRLRLPIAAAAFAAAIGILLPGSAMAQSNRTFVSAQTGNDSNPCSVTQPCRGFQRAHDATNAGGEILALDSGGYGTPNITKAITVTAPDGIEAGVTTNTSTDAIMVGAPGGVVNLRGLTLVGLGVGGNGVTLTDAATLNIQNCVVGGFTLDGLSLKPSSSTIVTVTDTIVSDNGVRGVQFLPGTTATASFKRVQSLRNDIGFQVAGTASTLNATAADSIAAGNASDGFRASTAGTFLIVNSKALNNAIGIHANGTTAIIAATTVSGNPINGYAITSGGQIQTFGNNSFTNNGTSIGALTPIAPE